MIDVRELLQITSPTLIIITGSRIKLEWNSSHNITTFNKEPTGTSELPQFKNLKYKFEAKFEISNYDTHLLANKATFNFLKREFECAKFTSHNYTYYKT